MKRLLAGLSLAAGALTPALAAGPTVTIGINSLTAIYWPTYVARAKGFYTKNGIEADIILTGRHLSHCTAQSCDRHLLTAYLTDLQPSFLADSDTTDSGGHDGDVSD
jgi:hypothetical protein